MNNRNIRNGVKRASKASVGALLATCCSYAFATTTILSHEQQSNAQSLSEPHNAQQQVEADLGRLAGQVRRAIVMAISNEWSFRRKMREPDLSKIGCIYDLTDPSSINLLTASLERMRFHAVSNTDDPNIRMGIYLYTENGRKVSLLLTHPHAYDNNEPVSDGIYDGTPLSVEPAFYEEVKRVLGDLTPTKQSFYCTSGAK